MNWLAHVFLSEPNVEFRLGNLLADIVKGSDRIGMSAEFLRGVACHRAIDSFTDAHPVVRRSRSRISSSYRRFSGVLVDIFYDYFLATQWPTYSSVSLDAFTADFYTQATACPITVPQPARIAIDRIVQHDLLGQYRHIEGVEHSLRRLSTRLTERWRREFALQHSVADLLANESGFAADFAEFFPELQMHVDSRLTHNCAKPGQCAPEALR